MEPFETTETMEREELRELQLERLRALLPRVRDAVPTYRGRWEEAGVDVDAIAALDDLARLPFTRKADLRDTYPFGLFAVPPEQVARIHGSSGTTGKPTIVGYTGEDLDLFATMVARCLVMAGARPGMKLHNAYGYGLFTGGLGLHGGAERLGMTVVPVSGGMTERQVTLIEDLRPDVICVTPTYALTLCQAFRERGVAPEEISLRYAVLGAEPWTEAMREEIDAGLGVRATNIYGLSEIIGPGVSGECVEARHGSHLNEDHFLAEIVDPETGAPLGPGEEGVLVITTLTKQALPLVRYWTGDITSLDETPCACGRTLARMATIAGRTDDMLIVRGVNVYPTQVATLLGEVAGLTSNYRLVLRRGATMDEVEVEVEAREGTDRHTQDMASHLARLIKETIGCSMTVAVLDPGALPRSDGGKVVRVLDQRGEPTALADQA
ncbi:MAG: phenylacetate--CoA ligase [Solirubrobacterales bacterium 70-9]|nr:MAG: phenylacetate--CoA ligase [Solirubrobacterales bacterium 70-9]